MSRRNKGRDNPSSSRKPSTLFDDGASNPTGPDIRQLRDEGLDESPFPGGRGLDFRIFFAPEVHPALWQHALAETSVEICGVLVGRWGRDADGPFVSVTGSIQGDAAESKFAEVTFTHQTWAKINEEMDRSHPDLTIVGWYHTHPDFGVFLSDRDVFIQQHFFSGPGHIAHVIDPIRKTEGVFVWKEGKPTLTPHFWVGPDLKTSTAAGSETGPSRADEASSAHSIRSVGPQESRLPPTERLLAYLCLLLLGYLLASVRSSWEGDRLAEGAVAHYGLWKGLRPGLGENLDQVSDRLRAVSGRVGGLAADHLKRLEKGEVATAAGKDWGDVRNLLAESAELLGKIKSTYDLSPSESVVVRELIFRKLQELERPTTSSPSEKAEPKKSEPTKTEAPSAKPVAEPSDKAAKK